MIFDFMMALSLLYIFLKNSKTMVRFPEPDAPWKMIWGIFLERVNPSNFLRMFSWSFIELEVDDCTFHASVETGGRI